MSTLTDLRAALADRADVEIVGEQPAFADPLRYSRNHGIVHWVTIFVGVKPGIYDAKQLTELQERLTPVAPMRALPFTANTRKPGYMGFGYLEYQEVIGSDVTQGTRQIIIRDVDVELPEDYADRCKVTGTFETKSLKRHIVIRLYPDVACAASALAGDNVHHTDTLAIPA